MWLLTPFGFFSVVKHRTRDCLIVRSRVHLDIRAMRDALPSVVSEPAHTPDADYPYRLEVTRAVLADAVREFVLNGIDYDNFKNEVARVQGRKRASIYGSVWAALRRLTPGAQESSYLPEGDQRGSLP